MKKLLTAIFMISLFSITFAQMHDMQYQNFSQLDTVSVTGVAIVENIDSTIAIYYLDEDGDGVADYHLNFGPYWYTPDSSNAVRPANGDNIIIVGGLKDSTKMNEPTIVVYSINDEFWRDPYYSSWNNMGHKDHKMRDKHHSRTSYGFGLDHDTATTVSLSGTTLIDTTYYMNQYFLDVDADGTPDYFLNFGPFWYQPDSGILRPEDGDAIEVVGGMLTTSMDEPMVIVYNLNGEVWKDSSSIGTHFGGGWLKDSGDSSTTFHSPFDNEDEMTIHSGWNNKSHGHMSNGSKLPDSMFCQIFETVPENVPNKNNLNVFASYEINMFQEDGEDWMMNDYMMGDHMTFGNEIEYKFHYSDLQLGMYNGDENSITVKYWDDVTSDWVTIDATVDETNNTVAFTSTDVNNIFVLSAEKVTAVTEGSDEILPAKFTLSQNYPNPFNPSTKIAYTLSNNSQVTLNVYNIVGEKVATLVSGYQNAGAYTVNFDATQLSSGVYFYELKADAVRLVKKMSLLK